MPGIGNIPIPISQKNYKKHVRKNQKAILFSFLVFLIGIGILFLSTLVCKNISLIAILLVSSGTIVFTLGPFFTYSKSRDDRVNDIFIKKWYLNEYAYFFNSFSRNRLKLSRRFYYLKRRDESRLYKNYSFILKS